MGTVLIVDDNEDLRLGLTKTIRKEGFEVHTASTGNACLDTLKSHVIDLIFLDIGLPDIDGIQLIPAIKKIEPEIDIVMITGFDDAQSAVESLKEGALDYIVKPFDIVEFTSCLNRIMQSRLMQKEARLSRQGDQENSFICSSEVMRPVQEAICKAAETNASVLITGETGTGKELVARAIHAQNQEKSKDGLFVKVDCGTLSENLIESELFGYDKGAFTDARSQKKGLVEMANGGTLFLDEIGNLPIFLQPKLLRLIEDSTFRKVGGLKDITVQVRIIAATNCDLKKEIQQGTFRRDLYYRLNVIPIHLPPLRERREDIHLLANFFLHRFKKELRKEIKGFTGNALDSMLSHKWQGNIRELKNLIEREVIFSNSAWITLNSLQPDLQSTLTGTDRIVSLKEMERRYIEEILRKNDNNKSKTARLLGISRTTLREKLKSIKF